jgi:hypothetical protein
MVKPPPISLRIRSAEATRHARELLQRLDEADHLQRRVKLQAAKALVAVRAMNSLATPKVRSMSRSNCEHWSSDVRKVEAILTLISQRGIWA